MADQWADEVGLEDPYQIIRVQAEEIMALQDALKGKQTRLVQALAELGRFDRECTCNHRPPAKSLTQRLSEPVLGQMELL